MIVAIQYMQSITFITLIMLYLFADTVGFKNIDIMFPILTVLTRSMIIGIRYAFMSNSRYSVMKLKQDFDWINNDLVVSNWDRISFESLNREIKATKYRLNFESDDLDFTFLKPLKTEWHSKLTDENYYKDKNIKMSEVVKALSVEWKSLKKLKKERKDMPSISPYANKNDVAKDAKDDKQPLSKVGILSTINRKQSDNNLTEVSNSHRSQHYDGKLLLREIAIFDQIETKSSKIAVYAVLIRTMIYIGFLGINYKTLIDFTAADYTILI